MCRNAEGGDSTPKHAFKTEQAVIGYIRREVSTVGVETYLMVRGRKI